MDSRQQFEEWQCEADDGPQVDPMWMVYHAETNTCGLDLIQRDWKVWQVSRKFVDVDRVSDELYGMYSTEIVRCVNDEWCEMLEDQGITWK